jgi:hypothetical protein
LKNDSNVRGAMLEGSKVGVRARVRVRVRVRVKG